ncbi:MAG: AraC family transcriptional regulator [Pseudomonadota bacterium]
MDMRPPVPDQVALYPITQATTATFADLYLRLTFLFFIQSGSKKVVTSAKEVVAEQGDLLIVPAGSLLTMENRPVLDRSYRALGVAFPDAYVAKVFEGRPTRSNRRDVEILRAEPHRPTDILPILHDTLERESLPDVIQRHRIMEPLIWLRDKGVRLTPVAEEAPLSRVRRLIETDLGHPWRADEVARQLAMSEATMRRWLKSSGEGFAKILMNARLEHGLSLLQTSDRAISDIALECGFKTPSHFSDAFRKRFGIAPRQIRTSAAV